VEYPFKLCIEHKSLKPSSLSAKFNSVVVVLTGRPIVAPGGTKLVTLVIAVSGCLLKTGEPTGSETHTIDIPYNDATVAAQVLEFQVNMPAESLVVTAARLIYKRFDYNTWVEMNKEAFVPAGVIDARYHS
jgi:hypothetical protein